MTKKRKLTVPKLDKLLLSLNTKEQNAKKSKDKPKTNNLIFEEKTKLIQQKKTLVVLNGMKD